MSRQELITTDAWQPLRTATSARIALGRAGGSLPTQEWLDFKAAHAAARDAVHQAFDAEELAGQIAALGVETFVVDTAASDRQTFLQRPDWGRRLAPNSAEQLLKIADRSKPSGVGDRRERWTVGSCRVTVRLCRCSNVCCRV